MSFGKKTENDCLRGTKGQVQLSDSPSRDFFLFCRLSLCLSVLHLPSNGGFLLVREGVKGHFGVGWRRERESKICVQPLYWSLRVWGEVLLRDIGCVIEVVMIL